MRVIDSSAPAELPDDQNPWPRDAIGLLSRALVRNHVCTYILAANGMRRNPRTRLRLNAYQSPARVLRGH
jgi:hypothetical protein